MTPEPEPDALTELLARTLRDYGPALPVVGPDEIARTLADTLKTSSTCHRADTAQALASTLRTFIMLDLYFSTEGLGATALKATTSDEVLEISKRIAALLADTISHYLTSFYYLIPRDPDIEEESTDTP